MGSPTASSPLQGRAPRAGRGHPRARAAAQGSARSIPLATRGGGALRIPSARRRGGREAAHRAAARLGTASRYGRPRGGGRRRWGTARRGGGGRRGGVSRFRRGRRVSRAGVAAVGKQRRRERREARALCLRRRSPAAERSPGPGFRRGAPPGGGDRRRCSAAVPPPHALLRCRRCRRRCRRSAPARRVSAARRPPSPVRRERRRSVRRGCGRLKPGLGGGGGRQWPLLQPRRARGRPAVSVVAGRGRAASAGARCCRCAFRAVSRCVLVIVCLRHSCLRDRGERGVPCASLCCRAPRFCPGVQRERLPYGQYLCVR